MFCYELQHLNKFSCVYRSLFAEVMKFGGLEDPSTKNQSQSRVLVIMTVGKPTLHRRVPTMAVMDGEPTLRLQHL